MPHVSRDLSGASYPAYAQGKSPHLCAVSDIIDIRANQGDYAGCKGPSVTLSSRMGVKNEGTIHLSKVYCLKCELA